ncbi:MAG: sodium/solute symporter [Tetragenococcus koreensis]|uniref:sodium:solute symporter family transporter n=1 Tax=Tetragenococcus halophilus TaxID=51669 RepID=UPI001EEACC9A|nr:sodium/solute symporter [Tetragenococcus halophilus]MDN6140042.1 sodium/solute symporter [Tetragenococcus koreensis]MDN6749353.1 sodium/solute symporter [Staphylococcus equorum]MCF1675289.1 sodium/solute symporter [Tetragenococcus halophilus]MDN6146767.1 sodium/solute symporter [Tetragenococcus koreensis]MDN6166229.1 sodium/solute symporter [Tetragenococcus koreensis]
MLGEGFTWVDLCVLVVYLVFVLFFGSIFAKKDMIGKEFFKGDGTIPWYVTSVSIFATLLSPISFLSLPGNSFGGSWILWFAQLGMIIAIPIAIAFFLPVFAKLDIDTAYDYLEKRFGSKGLRILGAIAFIVYQVGRMSIIIYLPSMVLADLTNINVNLLVIVMGGIAIFYSYSGGIKAVLWSDFLQGIVVLVGVSFSLIILLNNIDGGIGAIGDAFQSGKFIAPDEEWFSFSLVKDTVFLVFVGAGFNTLTQYVSSQDIVQRFTTTTNTKSLTKMLFTNGLLSMFIATVLFLIGTGLFVFYGQNNVADMFAQDQVYGHFIAYELPVGITGVILAAIFAASQSTLSTGLNSVSTSATLDIISVLDKGKKIDDKKQTAIARYITVFVGIFAIVVAIIMTKTNIVSAYEWFNGFVGLVLGVLGGTFALGIFTKKGNAFGAYAGFIIAAIVMITIEYILPEEYSVSIWAHSLISIFVAFASGYICSIIYSMNKKKESHRVQYSSILDFKKLKP